MVFYHYHLFSQEYAPKFFSLPEIKDTKKFEKQFYYTFGERIGFEGNSFSFEAPPMEGGQFKLIYTHNKRPCCVAHCAIKPVHYNCGAIHLSGLTANIAGCGLGEWLLQAVIKFATQAGYSIILCNTAGRDQNKYGIKHLIGKHGFLPMTPLYINKRSNNLNLWLYKPLELNENQQFELEEVFDTEDLNEQCNKQAQLEHKYQNYIHEDNEDEDDDE